MKSTPFGTKPVLESTTQIIAENLGPVIGSATLSMIGGVGLSLIERQLYFLLPVLIAIPALADMVGDFSTIIASKSVALIEQKKLPRDWVHSKAILTMAGHLLWISVLYSTIIGLGSVAIAAWQGFDSSGEFIIKLLIILMTIDVLMVLFLVVFSLRVGNLVAYHGHDPDNILIPIGTSLADVGVLLLFSLLVKALF